MYNKQEEYLMSEREKVSRQDKLNKPAEIQIVERLIKRKGEIEELIKGIRQVADKSKAWAEYTSGAGGTKNDQYIQEISQTVNGLAEQSLERINRIQRLIIDIGEYYNQI